MSPRLFAKLHTIHASVWIVVSALLLLSITSVVVATTRLVSSSTFLYVIQPLAALGIYGLVRYVAHDQQDRVHHRGDKAFLIGSILAVWFVIYFLSGLITTYVHNTLVNSLRGILFNLWAFGFVAYAIEYARHSLMLQVGRRNVVWFGILLATILAVQQMSLGGLQHADGLDGYIKLAFSNWVPAIVDSFLLTYLAISAGFPSMLTYRLGMTAIVILPPIIPHYDWYMQGMSLTLVAVVVFIAIDRTRQDKQKSRHKRINYYRHPQRAYDVMWFILMVALTLFMTGVFSYKPSAIASNSMVPVFSRGSIVVTQKLRDPVDVRIGDIVQYKRKDIIITHRVVAIDAATDGSGKRVFTTKGDNNPSKDPLVAESQVIGIVRSTVPYIGYPTVWLAELTHGSRPAP